MNLKLIGNYLNNLNDYGTFYIYHYSKKINNIDNKDIISNRCYVGYSKNNNLYSFVHGNIYGKFSIFTLVKLFHQILLKHLCFRTILIQFKSILMNLIKMNYFL